MATSYLLDPNWTMIEARFELDGIEEIFPGYHNPNRRWNGWACPWFTKDVAEKIAAALDGIRDDKNDRFVFIGALVNPDTNQAQFHPDMTDDEIWDLGGWIMYREDMPDMPSPLYTSDGICWMTTEDPSEAEQWATRYADAMRAEILDLMRQGAIPWNVHVMDVTDQRQLPFPTEDHNFGPFSRLHDYCDANMLGWDEVGELLWDARADKDEDGNEQGDATRIFNVASQRVDRWLSYGGHLWQAEDEEDPWEDEDRPPLFCGGGYYGADDHYVHLTSGDDPREVARAIRSLYLKQDEGYPRHWTVTVAV
jgi:hypothetical protein